MWLIMSARNYLSARDKNYGKLLDCLPNINQQRFGYRSAQELPPLSANTSKLLNRNLNFSYSNHPFLNGVDRAGTPLSDFFSESETGTPDFHSEESDSSSGSALRRSTAEASKTLAQEWDRIERTLYCEDGENCTRPAVVEECKQWRELHPQLRVVGKAIQLPERRSCYRQIEHDEIIAMHYSDYEQFSESDERLSQSSTDITPQNSPRQSIDDIHTRISRDKVSFQTYEEDLTDNFCSLLHITPIQIRSPCHRKKNLCILRSEMASSKWMKNRPDSSINCDRNSAKSFVSLDTRNYNNALSASERNNILNGRVVTARHRELARLEPFSNETNELKPPSTYNIRKVSLPPLLLEEEKRKVVSAKKNMRNRKNVNKGYYHLDRLRH